MGVLISNPQNQNQTFIQKTRQKAQAILNALGNPDYELSVLLTDDKEISELNHKYLNKNNPTNVIAFPMLTGDLPPHSQNLLGDVVISLETAQREAEFGAISFEHRFNQLLTHGILHLVGYDHVNDEEEAKKMEQKSQELLKIIKTIE